MNTLLLFLFMSANADTLSLPKENFFIKNITYEANITTKDGESKSGFLTNLDDSTISITQTIQANTAVNIKKYRYSDIAEIKLTRLHGSRAGNGLWKGALIGATTGALVGLISGDDKPSTGQFNLRLFSTAGDKAALGAIVLGLAGLLIGCLIGAFFKKKYKFNIDGNKENFDAMRAKLQ